MLKYFVESSKENARRADLDSIHEMIEDIRSNSKLEEAYMQSWEVEGYFTELGIQQGMQRGKINATNKIAIKMLDAGEPYEKIVAFTGLSTDELDKIASSKKE